MRIYVKVFTRSGSNLVKELADKQFEVRTTKLPQKGEANKEVIAMLAKHFRTAKSNIEIIGGKTTREKIVDVNI